MNRFRYLGALALVSCATTEAVRAGSLVAINYDLSSANTYEYTVKNVGLSQPLTDFVIYFPSESGPGEYTDIGAVRLDSPTGWTPAAYEPSALSLNGFVEWTASGAGLAVGDSLTGFAVSFTYSGTGTPGSQDFVVYDANFDMVARGTTTAVPEPSSLAGAAMLGLVAVGTGLQRRLRARE